MNVLEKVQAVLSAQEFDYDRALLLLGKVPHNASTLKYLSLGQDETREEILRYELEEWAKAQPGYNETEPEKETELEKETEISLPPDLASETILDEGHVPETPDGVYIIRGGTLDTFKCTVEQGRIKGYNTLLELAEIIDAPSSADPNKPLQEGEHFQKKSASQPVVQGRAEPPAQGLKSAASAPAQAGGQGPAEVETTPTVDGLKARATELYLERCKLSNRLAYESDEQLPALVEQILGLVEKHAQVWRQIEALQKGEALPQAANVPGAEQPKQLSLMSEAELVRERGKASSYLSRLNKGQIRASITDAERAQLAAMKESELKAISFYLDLIRNRERTTANGQ